MKPNSAFFVVALFAITATQCVEHASTAEACGEKRYCSEMNSCEEAYYYLRQCNLLRLDSDRDGVPCEALCANATHPVARSSSSSITQHLSFIDVETGAIFAGPGEVNVLDGDTIDAAGVRIRLQGIDAPERDQVCLSNDSTSWKCGEASRSTLIQLLANKTLSCQPTNERDKFGRTLARCQADGLDVNAWLVAEGWALSFQRYGDPYRSEQNAAYKGSKGLWRGAFIAPWDWRHRTKSTVILGKDRVPVNAQHRLLPPAM